MSLRIPTRILLLAAGLCPGWAMLHAQTPDDVFELDRENRIAAKVEGEIITLEEVRREMAPLVNQIFRRSGSEEEFRENLNRLQREVLQNLVDRILIVKEFREKEMTIPKSYLESEFNEVIQRDFNGERERFLAYLRAQNKTVRDFRRELEETIIVQVMRQRMRRTQAEISPERIEEYYRTHQDSERFQREAEVRLRQITIQAPDEAALEAKTAAVLEALEAGRDFAEVAREYSTDAFASRGGMVGWVKRNSIRPELEEVAFSLEPGEYGEPVPLGDARILYFLEEKREAGTKPLGEVRDEIERTLSDTIAREAQERWLQRLREKAFVEYYL